MDADRVGTICDALRERYGARALEVAEAQAGEADGEALVTWRAVAGRLSEADRPA